MTELLAKLFVKNHKDTSNPTVRSSYGTMVSIVGTVLNLLLFAAKFTVGVLVGSVAIRADAINNLSDAGSQIISFISFRISAKPADREHPHGHARIEYIASLIVSFLILYIGIDLLLESVDKIFHPAPPEQNWVTVGILAGSILVKLWIAFFNSKIGKRIDSSVMRATAMDSLSDVLSTTVILIAVLVSLFFPKLNLNLDAYMGAIVAILILVAGVKILLEAKDSILGEAPSDELVKQIAETVEQHPMVLGFHDLEVHNYGPGHIIAALHVEVDGRVNVFETHDAIDNLERELREKLGISATIHMDPILIDDETVNALRKDVAQAVAEIDPSLRIHDFRFVSGPTHSNLIFDVAVPFEVKRSDEDVRRAVADQISRMDPSYFAVITVDRV